MYPRYFADLLRHFFRNQSVSSHYHDALDPLLQYDVEVGYRVRGGNGSRLWVMSNLIARTGRVYRVEGDVVVYTMLGLGVAVLAMSVVGVLLAQPWLAQHFKAM